MKYVDKGLIASLVVVLIGILFLMTIIYFGIRIDANSEIEVIPITDKKIYHQPAGFNIAPWGLTPAPEMTAYCIFFGKYKRWGSPHRVSADFYNQIKIGDLVKTKRILFGRKMVP